MVLCVYVMLIAFDQAAVDQGLKVIEDAYTLPIAPCTRQYVPETWADMCDRDQHRAAQFLQGRSDIIVGDEPSETLAINGYFYNNGDIIVVNDGVLLIDHAEFYLDGDIIALNEGVVEVDSSQFTILQHFIYHRILSTQDSACFSITNTTTDFNGYQINVSVTGWGDFTMSNVINNDWITAVVMHDAHTTLAHVDYTGEWLFINRCSSQFTQVDRLLSWFFCEDSAIVDIDFPESDTVYGFVFDSTVANITNVLYHVEIDSSTNCIWAMIPLGGSDVTVRDSYLRVTGLMFEGVDSFAVTGLVNNLH